MERDTQLSSLFRWAMNLAFILEDDECQRFLFKTRLESIGFSVDTCTNVLEAKHDFKRKGDSYKAYFLDMKVPEMPGGEPTYVGGLEVRGHLLHNGVDSDRIYLMSADVSHNDELVAKEYGVSPKQIIAKDYFTERTLKELLEKK